MQSLSLAAGVFFVFVHVPSLVDFLVLNSKVRAPTPAHHFSSLHMQPPTVFAVEQKTSKHILYRRSH